MTSLPISVPIPSRDHKLFTSIVNEGIDARLEAFTLSKFATSNGRLHMNIHPDEIQILVRRLVERGDQGDNDAYSWADYIVQTCFGVEVRS
jgi:hypothetical protein